MKSAPPGIGASVSHVPVTSYPGPVELPKPPPTTGVDVGPGAAGGVGAGVLLAAGVGEAVGVDVDVGEAEGVGEVDGIGDKRFESLSQAVRP